MIKKDRVCSEFSQRYIETKNIKSIYEIGDDLKKHMPAIYEYFRQILLNKNTRKFKMFVDQYKLLEGIEVKKNKGVKIL